MLATAPIGGGAGLGAGRVGAHLEQSQVVDAGEAAASGSDFHQVDRRDGDREARALLVPVDAGPLEVVRALGLELLAQARLRGGATHVDAQEALLAAAARVRSARQAAGDRNG